MEKIKTALQLTNIKLQEVKRELQALYGNNIKAVKNDLMNIALAKNYNEYVLNDGFLDNLTDFSKVQKIVKLYPYLFNQI